MSFTLFRYLFREMLKVFGMTSFAVAGIMSFAGLLRPLTRFGLDGSQVLEVWALSLPVMGTYAVPVAALFASTFVYGRLANDNELTACRAAGMSYLAIIFPALVLGFLMATVSMMGLSFFVPAAADQVERKIYSNVSRLVANTIDRHGSITFPGPGAPVTVFARRAEVIPSTTPNVQIVRLEHVVIADLINTNAQEGEDPEPVPRQLFMARQATVYIEPPANDTPADAPPAMLRIYAELEGGRKLPMNTAFALGSAGVEAGLEQTTFGPIEREPVVRHKSRTLDMRVLHRLLEQPEQGHAVRERLAELIFFEQQRRYHESLAGQLRAGGEVRIGAVDGSVVRLRAEGEVAVESGTLFMMGPVRMRQILPDGSQRNYAAENAKLVASPVRGRDRMALDLQLGAGQLSLDGGLPQARQRLDRNFSIAMPADLRDLAMNPSIRAFLKDPQFSIRQRERLAQVWRKQSNDISSEIHSRLSFSVSCLISVVVGAALGMLLRSGNYLSAFATSVIPAALCIILIVTGKNVATNVPDILPPNYTDPLAAGVMLIWAGNLLVLLTAGVLVWRLQRT